MSSLIFLEVDPDDRALVQGRYPDSAMQEGVLADDALARACKDAEVVSCFIYTRFTRAVLEKLPLLKLICTRSVGYNHIDKEACDERGITICNVPDYGSHVIAEHVFALLLSTLRHIPEGGARVRGGEFDYHGLRGMCLRGKTLGIVGTGKIGRRVAQIAHGFGMHILAVDTCRTLELTDLLGVRYVELDEMLAQSDIITLHAPALPETAHMIDARAIGQMKDGVILVNTARGELIDSAALLSALKSGKIRHALLDVLEHEKNFAENKELIDHPHVVVTPHIAFYADESMRNMYEDAFQSIEQFRRGDTPEHAVKPERVVCDMKGVRK
ncbi:MAG: phosphoglycerate dehydrogenase [Candidatus Peregrinibacteria bacterium Gr01-1014_25]|nr:MAG: phosphoglycerate dehydrogenase [Candidatus Peregrinibacteria bacterium Gr01-1014_25]